MRASRYPPAVLAYIAIAGMTFFLATSLVAQWLRTDLDFLQNENSFYLIGPYGTLVRAGYFAMATGLVSLGGGWYATLSSERRSAAPLVLFVAAAVALVVTALARTDSTRLPVTGEGLIHVVAASAAFLCASVAMLLQAWQIRSDNLSRHYFSAAFSTALVCFAGLWAQAVPLPAPPGIKQKMLIVAMALWLIAAAILLLRRSARSDTRL